MAGRTLLALASLSLALTACAGGGPTPSPSASTPASTTPPASVTPSASLSPTPGASPSSAISAAAWAAEICALNVEYAQGLVAAQNASPEPSPRELVGVQQMWANRRPGLELAATRAIGRLDALTPLLGSETFHDALRSEVGAQAPASTAFFEGIATATSLEEVDGLVTVRNGTIVAALGDSVRAVTQLDPALIEAIAAVTSGCRFFEFDARAMPEGRSTEAFTDVALDDSFEAGSAFQSGAFEDGSEVTVAGGELSVSFVSGPGNHSVLTDSLQPGSFHDVRVESNIRNGGFGLAGLVCRSDGNAGYGVVVNPIGLILIYRFGDSAPLIGRAIAPAGFDASIGYHLAIECVRGGLEPLLIAVELDGARVAEVIDESPVATEGYAGMFSQWLSAGSETVFEDFKVTVKP